MSLDINVTELYRKGQRELQKKYEEEELKNLGKLRAGNTGVYLTETGQVAGNCHRKTYLRFRGVKVFDPDVGPINPSSSLMMEGGKYNENIWVDVLAAAGVKTMAETEIPTAWKLDNTVDVTGRPDLALVSDADGKPALGLELKQMCSLYTVKDVAIMGKPKFGHLAQAAHYMWKLGIPFKLCYVSRSDFHTGYNTPLSRELPKRGQLGSEWIDYNPKGMPKKIRSALVIFDLKLDSSGRLSYRKEGSGKIWTPTVISTGGIEDYYRGILGMEESNDLGPRPAALSPSGEAEGYKLCDYCELSEVCKAYEGQGLKAWKKAVEDVIASGKYMETGGM